MKAILTKAGKIAMWGTNIDGWDLDTVPADLNETASLGKYIGSINNTTNNIELTIDPNWVEPTE